MALASDLERVLSHILPMPATMAQGRLLGMPNHMEMIRDRLWDINGTIFEAEFRALKEPELEDWVTDVGAAIVDVDDLLGRILDWHPRRGAAAASNRSSRSICSIRVASRQAILLELKEMVRRLNYLVRRGSVLGLWKEILESVDPRQEEEYSTVLREEVVGRNEDVEKIIDILQQQQQSGDGVEWLLIDGEDGRTTLARLIYHHPWVREQFQHRIWVDVSKVAYLDPTMIMREFARSITGEPCEDIWLFYDGFHGSKYFLVLDDLHALEEDRDKWVQLENFLLLVGAPGSTVVVVPFFNSRLIESVLGSTRLIESIILGSTDLVFTQYKWGSSVRKYELGSLSKDDWVKLCMRQALIRPDQHEQANAIIQLPISVTNLVNLRELNLEGCQWLVELPEGLSNLKKLIDLNVYRCPLNQMPREISQMSNLLKLSGYNVIGGLGNVFSELQSLMNLKVLWLQNLEQVSNSEDALKLSDILPRLTYLKLYWKWDNTDDMRTSELVSLQVLEGLHPNPNLKKLEIISYANEEFPEWIKKKFDSLHKLKEIKLINLKKCKRLPSLGGLHDLKIIEISGMDLINAMDEAFYGENENGTFPNLEKLILSDMPALEKWLKVERRRERLFPRLRELTLIQCPKFEALEVDLKVTRLSIWLDNKMLRTSEFKGWHNLQSIEHLEIVGCQEMRRLPQGMQRCDGLQKLRIIGCDNLDCLPEWLSELKYLHSLYICGCRSLSSMPEELKRSPNVHVKGCPKL